MTEELVLDIDYNITKAEAKTNKLNREFEISKQKVKNIQKEIDNTGKELAECVEKQKQLNKEMKKIPEPSKKEIQITSELEKQKNLIDDVNRRYDFTVERIRRVKEELSNLHRSSKDYEEDLVEMRGYLVEQQEKLKLISAEKQEIQQKTASIADLEKQLADEHVANIERHQKEINSQLSEQKAKQKSLEKSLDTQNTALAKQKSHTVGVGEQIALNSKKTNMFSQGFKNSEKSAAKLGKRLKSLAASALFFSVATKAFTALREEFGKMITEQGTKTAELVTKLKDGLSVIGTTIYEACRPAIEWILSALVKIVNALANGIAKMLGKDINKMKKLAQATKKTGEEAKKTTAAFDTMQMIDTSSDSSNNYDNSKANISGITELTGEAEKKLNHILFLVGEIGLALLAWKLSSDFLGSLGGLVFSLGLTLAVDAIKDVIISKELTWESVIKGAIGGALAGAAIGFKLGGVGGAVLGAVMGIGITLLIEGIAAMTDGKITKGEVAAVIVGALTTIGSIISAVKMFNSKHKQPSAEFDTATETIEATNTGTSKLTGKLKSLVKNLALGIVILAEIAIGAGLLVAAIWGIGLLLQQVDIAWKPVIDNAGTVAIAVGVGTSMLLTIGIVLGLLGTLGAGLKVPLLVGVLILAEISMATDLFLIEIVAIGLLLQEVGKAWQPVLDNGETIKSGIKTGTGLLVAIGVVTAALGAATVASVGLLPIAIALGTNLLVDLAESLILFINELAKVANSMTYDLYPPLEKLNEVLPDLSEKMKQYTAFMKKFAGYVVDYTKSSTISGFSATVDSIIKFFTKDPIKMLSKDTEKQYEQADELNNNLQRANPALNKSISLLQTYYELLNDLSNIIGKINNVTLTYGTKRNSSLAGNIGNLFSKFVNFKTFSTSPIVFSAPDNIPALATGAVIPGGSPFLAKLGDQRRGQTNIEAPLDTIVEAFNAAQGNQTITINFKGSLSQLARILAPEITKENTRSSIFAKG